MAAHTTLLLLIIFLQQHILLCLHSSNYFIQIFLYPDQEQSSAIFFGNEPSMVCLQGVKGAQIFTLRHNQSYHQVLGLLQCLQQLHASCQKVFNARISSREIYKLSHFIQLCN